MTNVISKRSCLLQKILIGKILHAYYLDTYRHVYNFLRPEGNNVPLILPSLINNKLISNFKEKTKLFINYFASLCTPINNNSVLTTIIFHRTEARLNIN